VALTFPRLRTQPVTVTRPGPGTEDVYGNIQPTWDEIGTWWAVLEQTDAEEHTVGEDTQTADWRLYLPPDADIRGRDRVQLDDVTFEVVGPPNRARRPQGIHHIEAALRSTDPDLE
jgi:head-tail adaptor